MKIRKFQEPVSWVYAKSLEDHMWVLPEIDELFKMLDLGLLDDGFYYWSNTPSDKDKNWKKSLATVSFENRYPREVEGYKNKITGSVILIKKNEK